MFKILDKQNGEVTAEQQAVFNKISTNNADGYVDGFLNSLRIAKMSSNVISIDSGLLSIQGFRSVNDTLTTYTVSVTPSEPIPFQLVATYSHYISDENDTLEITTRPTQDLRREPLFSGQNAVYEVELAEFNMTADGIADFVVTLEKIVYNEQDLSELLDKVTKAEQDSATALEKVNELETQVIEKQGTTIYVGGTAQSRVDFTSDPQGQIDNIIIGATTVGKATADGNGNIFANYYLPINNKSLPSLSNNYVSQSTLKELCDSFNLKYGESTTPLYFESGTNYSNIQGLIQPSGVTYKQYNFLQVTRQAGSMYMITVYAGYNAQVQMTIPPQYFFVTSGGISPATDNIRFKNTVTDLNVQLSPNASSGIFNYGNNTSNAPTTGAGTLIHYQFTANYATQMAVAVNQNGYIYRRTYYNGSWGDWKSALIINISNLKPWEDSTGWSYGSNPKLTEAGTYLVAAAYTPSSQAPFYYMPTIMPFDGENGIAPIFDRDGLMDNGKVVANDEGIQVRSGPTKVDTTLIYYQKIS